jgi:hypothetical protein
LQHYQYKDSWDNQIYIDGVQEAFEYGRGYVWTQVLPKRTILNTDINEWKADDHTPALYAKTIVDKIFDTKGISILMTLFSRLTDLRD